MNYALQHAPGLELFEVEPFRGRSLVTNRGAGPYRSRTPERAASGAGHHPGEGLLTLKIFEIGLPRGVKRHGPQRIRIRHQIEDAVFKLCH